MSRLSRLKLIKNWDVLDDFYGYEVKGINIKFNKNERSFCKCGETTSAFRDKCDKCGNFNFITKVNQSLNIMNKPKGYFENREHIDKKGLSLRSGNSLDSRIYYLTAEETGSELVFSNKYDIVNSIINDNYLNINIFNADIGKIEKEYPSLFKDFDEECENLLDNLKDIISLFDEDDVILSKFNGYGIMNNLLKISAALYIKQNYSDLLNSKLASKYPFIIRGHINDVLLELFYKAISRHRSYSDYRNIPSYSSINGGKNQTSPYSNKDEAFYSLINKNISSKYYPLIDFTSRQEGSLYRAIYGDSNEGRYYGERSLIVYDKIINEQKTGYENVINHYVLNGMISWWEGLKAIKQIDSIQQDLKETSYRCTFPKYFDTEWKYCKPETSYDWDKEKYKNREDFREFFDKKYLEFFPIFLKENVSSYKKDLVPLFIEKIKTMIDYKISIKEENFKVKTFNFLVNQACLGEKYRMPQGKVDLFLDMFEVNPLEAMKLLANRRKLTKKEQEEFLNTMLKNL